MSYFSSKTSEKLLKKGVMIYNSRTGGIRRHIATRLSLIIFLKLINTVNDNDSFT